MMMAVRVEKLHIHPKKGEINVVYNAVLLN